MTPLVPARALGLAAARTPPLIDAVPPKVLLPVRVSVPPPFLVRLTKPPVLRMVPPKLVVVLTGLLTVIVAEPAAELSTTPLTVIDDNVIRVGLLPFKSSVAV